MNIIETSLHNCLIIEPKIFEDERGFFYESFQERNYKKLAGIKDGFVQDNFSYSKKNVLRGLHFQKNNPQGKLVRVVVGEVYDVVVDLRKNSNTFLKWFGVNLSEHNNKQLWVPPGLAHGFLVLSESAAFEYKCTDFYNPKDEFSLLWNDPKVGINWPIKDPLLSDKDKNGLLIDDLDL